MSTVTSSSIWSQELQVHWPKSWRFLASRDLLLEMFTPRVFNVSEDRLYVRYGENQDLRLSPYGLHIRILSLELMDKPTAEVVERVLRVIEPDKLMDFQATFSHVRPIDIEYDKARRSLAPVFHASWIQDHPIKDFTLLWEEYVSHEAEGRFAMGVVNQDELLSRIAQASGTAVDVLRRQTPAWMKVRMPRVALYMESHYTSAQEVSLDPGLVPVPQIWREWRERSDGTFNQLVELVVPAQKGEA